MGGGNFVVPAQTVPDFLDNKLSGNDKVLHAIACQQSAPNVALSQKHLYHHQATAWVFMRQNFMSSSRLA